MGSKQNLSSQGGSIAISSFKMNRGSASSLRPNTLRFRDPDEGSVERRLVSSLNLEDSGKFKLNANIDHSDSSSYDY